jgi:hypothetical protein
MFNDAPSYRVGEAPRAHPKGLTRLPNIYNLERYQLLIVFYKLVSYLAKQNSGFENASFFLKQANIHHEELFQD